MDLKSILKSWYVNIIRALWTGLRTGIRVAFNPDPDQTFVKKTAPEMTFEWKTRICSLYPTFEKHRVPTQPSKITRNFGKF